MTNIQQKREDAKLSAQELASRAGISPSKLSKIAHGKLKLKLVDAKRLARALGCKTDDLHVEDDALQPVEG